MTAGTFGSGQPFITAFVRQNKDMMRKDPEHVRTVAVIASEMWADRLKYRTHDLERTCEQMAEASVREHNRAGSAPQREASRASALLGVDASNQNAIDHGTKELFKLDVTLSRIATAPEPPEKEMSQGISRGISR